MRKIFFILLLLCCKYLVANVNIPRLAPAGYNGLSPFAEQQLGQRFYQFMMTHAPIVHDPLINASIDRLGFKLVSFSKKPQQHFLFFIVKDSTINAFAGPDGYIGLNSGLLLFARNEGELASVIAHEIAHVTERHIAQQIEAANKGALTTALGVLAGLVTGVPALAIGAMGANAQSQVTFTRTQEREADLLGMQTLKRAQYNANDMATMFQHMRRASDNGRNDDFEFLRSHPLTENRIAHAQNQAGFTAQKRKTHYINFLLMQTRLQVLTTGTARKNLLFYQKKIQQQPYNTLQQYAYALALMANNQAQKAVILLKQLNKFDPGETYYIYSLSHAYALAGDHKQAIDTINNALEDYPRYRPFILLKANLLLQDNQAQQAADFLHRQYRYYENDLSFLNLYQRALGESGQLVWAYQVRAQILLQMGQPKAAVAQLQQALLSKNINTTEELIIKSMLQKINHTKKYKKST